MSAQRDIWFLEDELKKAVLLLFLSYTDSGTNLEVEKFLTENSPEWNQFMDEEN
jgi:hypothetical protein